MMSPYQTCIIPLRNIHENIITAKEVLHGIHNKKDKVDLSKAYDNIS